MHLLPHQYTVLVLPITAEEIENRLRQTVTPLPDDFSAPELPQHDFVFNGWIKEDRFRISRRINHAENFLPLVIGKIESSSKGSILFVNYRMFPSALFFMLFFCTLLIACAFYFLISSLNWLAFGLLLASAIGVYGIGIMDFNQKVKTSKSLLEKVLCSA